MSLSEICFMTASEIVQNIKDRKLSAREIMAAHLEQIERVNPQVNAIITLLAERAMDGAAAADEALARGDALGPLHGIPIAHKDLVLTKGIRTTYGSPILEDFVPQEDALIVERLRNGGAITIGKTNTPEFGAGSQTFNEVFGETLNPYDTSKTCGGSSGGAAVALACGMLPIADGSDMGGSLRNPASFCNVVGLRPSPGRVPSWPTMAAWSTLPVEGPMARTVQDVALMLSVMAGPDPRSPIALSQSGSHFSQPLERRFKGVNIAWSPDLGGLPVDQQVVGVIEKQIPVFKDLGCTVEEQWPDFSDADEIFKVFRALNMVLILGDLYRHHRDKLKDTIIWNIEEGLKLTGSQVAAAESKKSELYHRVRQFMQTFEYLILPVSQVPPFDINQQYITSINGHKMETYIDWMKSCYYITATGHPAISVPCGFTPDGLPVGIQIVGRHQDDFGLLQLANAFEKETEFGKQRPSLAV